MPVVCTVGYQHHTPESLVALLKRNRVKRVVDVRWNPISRKAGFGSRQLRDALERAGIAYEHIRELGVPQAIRYRTLHRDDWSAFRRYVRQRTARHAYRFLELPPVTSGLDCLLCLETDPAECHRTIVAGFLERTSGFTVRHL